MLNELQDTLAKCYNNTGLFGKTFKPEAFSSDFCSLHDEILRLIDSDEQRIAIAAPRGIGKTTIVRTLVEKSIEYRDYEFVLYVSNSASSAELQTENIKRELKTNTQLRALFGDIEISDSGVDYDETFSKLAWVAYGHTLVLPRGMGQQVRGLTYKHFRPQLIIVDDLEKRDELENPDIRNKIKSWFSADLLRCVDRFSKKWRIIYIDTLKHEDSNLEKLLNTKGWATARLELFGDDYKSNAPMLMSDEEIAEEIAIARENGELDIIYMEFRNIAVAKENRSFDPKYFRYYDERDLQGRQLENIIIVDPAKTVQMQNADSAVVCIGVDYTTGAMYVRDIVAGKMFPDRLYDEMFKMRARFRVNSIGIEVTGLEEFIKQPILNEMTKRGPGNAFEPVWLKARMGSEDEKGKLKRIGALVPYYRQGYVFHNPANCAMLESQLTSFPRGKRVDVADATAYIIEMLEIGERYFTHPVENDLEMTPLEAEYDDLDYEPSMSDDSYYRI